MRSSRSRGAVAAVWVAAMVVVTVGVLGSALAGPWVFVDRNPGEWAPPGDENAGQPGGDLDLGGPDEEVEVPEHEGETPPSRIWLYLLRAAVVILVVWLIVRFIRGRAFVMRRQPQISWDVTEPDSGAVTETMNQAVSEARWVLDTTTDPSDGIVQAWLILEMAASKSGVPRDPAQTPTEFTVAVLDRTDVDGAAVANLLGLYHRARFSSQPSTSEDVRSAQSCLDRIAGTLKHAASVNLP